MEPISCTKWSPFRVRNGDFHTEKKHAARRGGPGLLVLLSGLLIQSVEGQLETIRSSSFIHRKFQNNKLKVGLWIVCRGLGEVDGKDGKTHTNPVIPPLKIFAEVSSVWKCFNYAFDVWVKLLIMQSVSKQYLTVGYLLAIIYRFYRGKLLKVRSINCLLNCTV